MRGDLNRGGREARRVSAKSGYDAALHMWSTQSTAIWSSFTAILYANIAILALIGALFTLFKDSDAARFVGVVICIGGLFGCVIWIAIVLRMFTYHDYWLSWARMYERRAFGQAVRMIQDGRAFAAGRAARLTTVLI